VVVVALPDGPSTGAVVVEVSASLDGAVVGGTGVVVVGVSVVVVVAGMVVVVVGW
jgi:hypothetical protein